MSSEMLPRKIKKEYFSILFTYLQVQYVQQEEAPLLGVEKTSAQRLLKSNNFLEFR